MWCHTVGDSTQEQSEAGKNVELDELSGLACSGAWDHLLYIVGILEGFLRSIPHGDNP